MNKRTASIADAAEATIAHVRTSYPITATKDDWRAAALVADQSFTRAGGRTFLLGSRIFCRCYVGTMSHVRLALAHADSLVAIRTYMAWVRGGTMDGGRQFLKANGMGELYGLVGSSRRLGRAVHAIEHYLCIDCRRHAERLDVYTRLV